MHLFTQLGPLLELQGLFLDYLPLKLLEVFLKLLGFVYQVILSRLMLGCLFNHLLSFSSDELPLFSSQVLIASTVLLALHGGSRLNELDQLEAHLGEFDEFRV